MEGGPPRDPPTSQINEAIAPASEVPPNQEGVPPASPRGPISRPAPVPRGLAGINARTREMATAKLPPSLRAKLEEVCDGFDNNRMRGARQIPCLSLQA